MSPRFGRWSALLAVCGIGLWACGEPPDDAETWDESAEVDAEPGLSTGTGLDEYESMMQDLTGCQGRASTYIPPSGRFYLTTFGGPGDGGRMSCGSNTRNGTWYYAASRQRYGCGSHVKITTPSGRCVVAQTDDYGPDVCVERAANRPIIDVAPVVARALFGVSAVGWSEHRSVYVKKVSASTRLGPCR